MLRCLKKFVKNQRGQTLVELALIIPILILVLMATLEFGRIFFTYLTVTHASREAARATVIYTGKDDAFIEQRVKDNASWLSAADLDVEITPTSASSRTTGVPLTVLVKYPVVLYTPVLKDVMTNPFTVQAHTTMRIE